MTKREARQLLNERAIDLPANTINLLRRLVDLVRVPDVQTSDIDGFTACPKISSLALRLRVSERQVTDMISQLRQAGLISVACCRSARERVAIAALAPVLANTAGAAPGYSRKVKVLQTLRCSFCSD